MKMHEAMRRKREVQELQLVVETVGSAVLAERGRERENFKLGPLSAGWGVGLGW
jgi:hypothetical protein